MTPTIHLRDQPLVLRPDLEVPFQSFETEWYGQPLPFQAGFHLAQSPERLQFIARCDVGPDHDGSLKRGQFKMGLWERDVAEMFILDEATGHYQEWNLSPAGAWWTQRFLAARKPDPDFQPNKDAVTTWSHIRRGEGWMAALEIPALDPAATRLQICMIVKDMSGERRYLTVSPQPDIKPDFHRPQTWPKPEVKAV